MHAFQGRSFDPKAKTKYFTIVNDESEQKIYGLDTLNVHKNIYVFEGPIDAMFIPNSIATAGGDLTAIQNLPKDKLVICYDNEPRSFETKKKIDKAITQGYNVCIWPSNIEQKDINDMVINGYDPIQLQMIIDQNTHKNLSAKMRLMQWSKV
jgi:hypothetical protein